MAIGMGTGHAERCAINITPLIDVLLVLLIIFMVIQPSLQHGLSALAPRAPRAPSRDPDPRAVVIAVHGNANAPRYTCNGEAVTLAQLDADLRNMVRVSGQRTVFVQAEPGLQYGSVTPVLSLAHAAGVEQVGLMPARF